jgi:hypothetical protein
LEIENKNEESPQNAGDKRRLEEHFQRSVESRKESVKSLSDLAIASKAFEESNLKLKTSANSGSIAGKNSTRVLS